MKKTEIEFSEPEIDSLLLLAEEVLETGAFSGGDAEEIMLIIGKLRSAKIRIIAKEHEWMKRMTPGSSCLIRDDL